MRRYSPWSLSSVWQDACAIRALAYRAGGAQAAGAFTTEGLEASTVFCAFDAVDQTMLAGNAPRPPAGEITFKGLGRAEPGEGMALDVLDQRIYLVAYPLLPYMFRTLDMCK